MQTYSIAFHDGVYNFLKVKLQSEVNRLARQISDATLSGQDIHPATLREYEMNKSALESLRYKCEEAKAD